MKSTKTYTEKLLDPRWQRKRLEVLSRDEFTCRHCRDKKSTLHVHHLRYIKGRNPWEYETQELITLCETCHREIKQITDVIGLQLQDDVNVRAFLTLASLIQMGWGFEAGELLTDLRNSVKQ